MFTKVHHVTYVVESIQQMADYLEKNFGLKPERTDEFADRGFKAIMYQIGPTLRRTADRATLDISQYSAGGCATGCSVQMYAPFGTTMARKGAFPRTGD